MTTHATKLVTADELLAMGDIGRCELIRGEIVHMSPAGFDHGTIAARLTGALVHFVGENKLGIVATAEAGYRIERDPDTVRAPDVSFVAAGRPQSTPKFFDGAPDLAVEVMSPSDSWSEVNEKVDVWLAAGCRSCWVVDPRTQSVTIYAAGNRVVRLRENDQLTDEQVLPGFAMPVRALFQS